MTGILCIDKPQGYTSFDVVAKLRGMAQTRKVGHAGTLDPMATGVLPLFFGRATKAGDIMPCQDKRYRAKFRLGVVTDTQDITGTVLERREVSATAQDVERVLARFCGEIDQIPPMYSAVRVGGKRLYDLARRGVEVERASRKITIYSLSMLEADDAAGEYVVDVHCSKGTYIRTLCHDIGQMLGCGATLTQLRRTEANGFTEAQCITLERAQAFCDAGQLERNIMPVEAAFSFLPKLLLSAGQARQFQNGVKLPLADFCLQDGETQVGVWEESGRFLGIARPDWAENRLRLVKLFALEAGD